MNLLIFLFLEANTKKFLRTVDIEYNGENMVVEIDEETCIACGMCEEECPVDALSVDDVAVVDADACEDIGDCVEVCPVDALSL